MFVGQTAASSVVVKIRVYRVKDVYKIVLLSPFFLPPSPFRYRTVKLVRTFFLDRQLDFDVRRTRIRRGRSVFIFSSLFAFETNITVPICGK